jgi:hypothetical protein
MRRILFNIGLILIIIGSMVLPMVFPSRVMAATVTLGLTGEGTDNTMGGCGTYFGGAGDYTVLNDDNGDASFWFVSSTCYTGWRYHSYNTGDLASGIINNVRFTIKARQTEFAEDIIVIKPYVYIGGVRYFGSESGIGTTYVEYYYDWAVNPATGSAWTTSGYNNAEFGFAVSPSLYSGSIYITYTPITLTYTVPAVPTVTSSAATGVGYTGGLHRATLNGSIDGIGGVTADFRGFVYGTTSNSTTPASTQVPPAGYTSNWTEPGSFGTGSFSHEITGLLGSTTYYFRAFAHNSIGWAYGSQLSFTTLFDPDITTQAATYIGATTARLNALVVNDGGQLADVRFFYSTVSGNCTDGAQCDTGAPFTCNTTSYNGTTPWVLDTYATGTQPYVDLSGLVASKTYYFCAQIRNDVGCRCGGQLSFTTASGISEPTQLKGIPTDTTISLLWVKGVGSSRTLIRYKPNTYPTGVADGTQAYLDTKNTVVVPSLTMGTTYYFMAWGESGGFYSTSNATLMMTTTSGDSAAGVPLAPTATGTSWFQSPDYTNMSAFPMYGMINWWADSFGMPRSTLWFFCAMFLALACGILVYWKGGQKIVLTGLVVILLIGFGVSLKLVSMWLLLPFLIVFFTSVAVGERI